MRINATYEGKSNAILRKGIRYKLVLQHLEDNNYGLKICQQQIKQTIKYETIIEFLKQWNNIYVIGE